ncbi:uncharacterized protein A4U43_C04F17120 [Asparagus officinalis]|uniref:Transthyretin/hydroxyisourate hydrolase domain-containing protein n=1 Tax=Asparagus officinalis TaxID=4686 RepID=A0A5P1F3A9_ASPOF|nr:uncharacterized protein A4U43_C04F17120 [Asparagus officinalis]
MKIIELRLARLFKSEGRAITATSHLPVSHPRKPEARIGIIAAHLNADAKASTDKAPEISVSTSRTRPPITTHVLDVARGYPAPGLEVHLEMWKETHRAPSFTERDSTGWVLLGSSVTNTDGRSGQGVAEIRAFPCASASFALLVFYISRELG